MRRRVSREKPSLSASVGLVVCAATGKAKPMSSKGMRDATIFRFIVNLKATGLLVQGCGGADGELCGGAARWRLARAGDGLTTADPEIDGAGNDAARAVFVDDA